MSRVKPPGRPRFGAFDLALAAVGLGFLIREWFGDYRVAINTLAVVSGWAFTGMPMIFCHAGPVALPTHPTLEPYHTVWGR